MSDTEPPKATAKAKPAASKEGSKAVSKPASPGGPKTAAEARAVGPGGPKTAAQTGAVVPRVGTPPAAQPKAPPLPREQQDEAPIAPRNRHERRSAGKKRPGQRPFKWPPIGPERP